MVYKKFVLLLSITLFAVYIYAEEDLSKTWHDGFEAEEQQESSKKSVVCMDHFSV